MLPSFPEIAPDSAKTTSEGCSLHDLLLQTSNQLAKCSFDEVDQVVLSALDGVRELELAERSGWFTVSDSGKLRDVSPAHRSTDLERLVKRRLQELPWCLSQLLHGQPVILRDVKRPLSWSPKGQASFGSGEAHSVGLIPSSCSGVTRGLFVMFSAPHPREWSDETVDECVLLANILWSASQRKIAKNEDEAEGQRLMRLFRIFTIGMAVLDQDGIFTAANAAFCKASGYAENHLWMKPFETVFSPVKEEISESGWQAFRHARSAGRQIERRLTRKDGSSTTARIVVTPLSTSTEHSLHSLVIIEALGEGDCSHLQLNGEKSRAKSIASQLIQCQENERKRLSRELHDDIGQRMSLVTSEVALLASQYSNTTPVLGDRLISVRDHLDHLCSDLHCMSHSLHSYKLQHLGLKCALKDLCRQLSTSALQVNLNVDSAVDPRSEAVSLCLYRVAQEALSNCVKHAQARIIAVTLTKLRNTFYMTVSDSGIGFNTRAKVEGLGFVSMRERLTLVNGRLRVRSAIGGGTEIWVSIPDQFDQLSVESEEAHPSTLGKTAASTEFTQQRGWLKRSPGMC
jgi:PAS domain S-box-containing protein